MESPHVVSYKVHGEGSPIDIGGYGDQGARPFTGSVSLPTIGVPVSDPASVVGRESRQPGGPAGVERWPKATCRVRDRRSKGNGCLPEARTAPQSATVHRMCVLFHQHGHTPLCHVDEPIQIQLARQRRPVYAAASRLLSSTFFCCADRRDRVGTRGNRRPYSIPASSPPALLPCISGVFRHCFQPMHSAETIRRARHVSR
jgi:hypothetical protein